MELSVKKWRSRHEKGNRVVPGPCLAGHHFGTSPCSPRRSHTPRRNRSILLPAGKTEAEISLEHQANLITHLSELGIDSSDVVSFDRTTGIILMNDGMHYRVQSIGPETMYTTWYDPGDQGEKGMVFGPEGGFLSYAPTGGHRLTQPFSIGFSTVIPNTVITVSVSFDAGDTNPDSGVYGTWPVPKNKPGYYKLRIKKEFSVETYIIYKWLWDEVSWSHNWEIYSQSDSYVYEGAFGQVRQTEAIDEWPIE